MLKKAMIVIASLVLGGTMLQTEAFARDGGGHGSGGYGGHGGGGYGGHGGSGYGGHGEFGRGHFSRGGLGFYDSSPYDDDASIATTPVGIATFADKAKPFERDMRVPLECGLRFGR